MDDEIKKLNEKRTLLLNKLDEIRKEKIGVEEEIKNKKVIEKEKPKSNNHGSKLIRVHQKFDDKMEDINNKREEKGLDKLSKPKITELIIRHKQWKSIESGFVNFDINAEGEELYD